MKANEKKISLEFETTKINVTKRIGDQKDYFELNLFDYDTELLFPEEGLEPQKRVVTEFFGFYSKNELKEIIKTLQHIIEDH